MRRKAYVHAGLARQIRQLILQRCLHLADELLHLLLIVVHLCERRPAHIDRVASAHVHLTKSSRIRPRKRSECSAETRASAQRGLVCACCVCSACVRAEHRARSNAPSNNDIASAAVRFFPKTRLKRRFRVQSLCRRRSEGGALISISSLSLPSLSPPFTLSLTHYGGGKLQGLPRAGVAAVCMRDGVLLRARVPADGLDPPQGCVFRRPAPCACSSTCARARQRTASTCVVVVVHLVLVLVDGVWRIPRWPATDHRRPRGVGDRAVGGEARRVAGGLLPDAHRR